MKNITDILTEIVSCAFEKCGYDKKLGGVTASDRLDLCQFQCNGAFAGAKLYKKAPIAIAKELSEELSGNEAIEKAEAAAPGFINIKLKDSFITEITNKLAADENLGIRTAEKPQTIVIDYGGANVAKPLHIGHLRSAIIGEATKRLAKAVGHNVIGDVHLGDWGTQMGLIITELEDRHPDWACFGEDYDGSTPAPALDIDLLNEIYPFASKKSKEDEEYKQRALKATAELQNGRSGYTAVWKEILKVSLIDLRKSYDRLNVNFDLWYGESDSKKYIDELVSRLEEKGLLQDSNGAKIVELKEDTDKAPMPPILIKKSDNSNLYATTDLATIIQREKDFHPDKIWYLTDTRQGLHFTQVFRCAKKAELVGKDTEFEFLNFGTMNGSDGKPFKTRDGGVMKLSDLLDSTKKAAIEKLDSSSYISSLSDSEKDIIAEKVSIAAIKFGDLINQRAKDYIFDLDKFLSFEGKTGTYILYTITRMNSILKKVGIPYDTKISLSGIYSEAERELLLKIMLTGEAFERAFSEKAPNFICDNAFSIASLFSTFYHDCHIMDEPDESKKSSWIALTLLTRKVLIKHMDVLGIQTVENM